MIGAGPGDPGLITVTGLNRLREAEVVVYDALANPTLLGEAPPTAVRIDVGKRARDHKLSQDAINQLLVDHARKGRRVVRLKGGDPYLFGRGAEECAFVASNGIPCEVVPGVTSGIAAPATAGIPVTHRKMASTVTIVTGHEDPTKPDTSVDYEGLSRLIQRGGTACFYMGVGRLPLIVESLASFGLDVGTPAAVVQWGTLPNQRAVRDTLGGIADAVQREGVSSPAIIVVGQVAGIDDPGLDFFTARPLFGRRILVTRTRQQASELRQRLADLGADVIEAPTLELVPPDDWEPIDQALAELDAYDWLLLTSANAVNTMADRFEVLGLDARQLASLRLAVVGEATAEALWDRLRVRPDFMPTEFAAESMAGQLIAERGVSGKHILLLRADIARPGLPRLLSEAGAVVDEVVAYQTRLPAELDQRAVDALIAGEVDWVTFTSSSTARNLVTLLGDKASLVGQAKRLSIGPVTTATLVELGLSPTVEADAATITGMVEALIEAESNRR